MSKKKTIAVEFNTDEEAGAVYGTLRRLKREGYCHSYGMYEDYVLILGVRDVDVDTVLKVFYDLSAERGLPGISAQID